MTQLTKDGVLQLLRQHSPVLAERFGVTRLALYGSFARNQAIESSDIDILASFDPRPDWKRYFGTQFYLEDLLGRRIDLAMDGELRPEIRSYVERDLTYV